MKLTDIPFAVTDWQEVTPTDHPGEQGHALWRTRDIGPLRVRVVDYSPGYCADHWCSKGHLVFCLAGELHTELADGRVVVLGPGMGYEVADDTMPHRSMAPTGAKLLIVD